MLALLAVDLFDELQARRHDWGADKWDEVWDSVPHLRPVGAHSDLQQQVAVLVRNAAIAHGLVPVLGAFEPRDPGEHPEGRPGRLRGDQVATAALAVDIVTSREDRPRRLSWLASARVEEVVILDLDRHSVEWLALADGRYEPVDTSGLLGLSAAWLAEAVAWQLAPAFDSGTPSRDPATDPP